MHILWLVTAAAYSRIRNIIVSTIFLQFKLYCDYIYVIISDAKQSQQQTIFIIAEFAEIEKYTANINNILTRTMQQTAVILMFLLAINS